MHKRIVLTGGHAATTALAVIEEARKEHKNWDIYWIGSGTPVEGKDIPTLEANIFPKIGVTPFFLIAGRLQRRLTRWTVPSLLKIPIGFIQAFYLLGKIKPHAILSFGGFAAVPVVTTGWLLAIPVIIHDQTMAAGLANRLTAFFATNIALARAESKKYFSKEKCVITGNPVLTQIAEIAPKEKIGTPPAIFITLGSRGAQRINKVVESILGKLLVKYRVLHITGPFDYKKFAKIKTTFPSELRKNYEVYSTVDPMKIDGLYKEADIIVGRAGANTVSEVIVTKRPAVLIPIPWTQMDEQTLNANFARDFGIAMVLTEDKLSEVSLLNAINIAVQNWDETVSAVSKKKSPDIGASSRLVDLVSLVLKTK